MRIQNEAEGVCMSDIYKEMKMTPETTIAEICSFAMRALIEHRMDSFDFDIHGMGPSGPVILHFEATLQRSGKA